MKYLEPEKPELARLMPVDKSQERQAVSAFLATLMSVDEFGKDLLRGIGAKCTKTSKIRCYTEVAFASKNTKKRSEESNRPDGLIIVTTGGQEWRALVEAKVSRDKQKAEQINTYLDIAKEQELDAVITISSEYVADPEIEPDSIHSGIDRRKTRSVKTFHWSWAYLLNEAHVWLKEHKGRKKNIHDTDQKYILKELVRFFEHPNSGVIVGYDIMGKDWKTACEAIQMQIPLASIKEEAREATSSWQKLVRSLSLQMGMRLGENVTIPLSREHRKNPLKRLNENTKRLSEKHILNADFHVPYVDSLIRMEADVKATQVRLLMKVKANLDRPTAKGRVNDFLKQIPEKSRSESLHIRSIMPRKSDDKEFSIQDVIKRGSEILYEDNKIAPKEFMVIKIIDIGKGTFNSIRNKLPAMMIKELLDYYEKVGRHLESWKDSPPRSKPTTEVDHVDKIIVANDKEIDIKEASEYAEPSEESQDLDHPEDNDDQDNDFFTGKP